VISGQLFGSLRHYAKLDHLCGRRVQHSLGLHTYPYIPLAPAALLAWVVMWAIVEFRDRTGPLKGLHGKNGDVPAPKP